jgi:putative Mn2+ efflux pump MntP
MAQASQPGPDDIAFIRQLSESGARAPLIGGRFTAWWGLLLTIAYLGQHLVVTGVLTPPNLYLAIIWFGFGILGGIGQTLLARGVKDKPGAGSAGNLAVRAVWTAAAWSIVAMVVGSSLISDGKMNLAAGPHPWDFIVPVAFAVYACAQWVGGALAGNRMLKVAATGAIVMVGLFTAISRWPDRYLLVAGGIALTVMIPGLLLVRAEPRG